MNSRPCYLGNDRNGIKLIPTQNTHYSQNFTDIDLHSNLIEHLTVKCNKFSHCSNGLSYSIRRNQHMNEI